MSNKYTLLTFKGICMNFLLELKFFILSHPVTSKKLHKIVQIHMGHPVDLIVRSLETQPALRKIVWILKMSCRNAFAKFPNSPMCKHLQ